MLTGVVEHFGSIWQSRSKGAVPSSSTLELFRLAVEHKVGFKKQKSS
jgi:hypothetical protein